VRRTVLSVAIGVVALVTLKYALSGKDPEPPPEDDEPRVVAEGEWGWVDVADFRLWLPKGWAFWKQLTDGWIFRGPEVDGFRPNVHLYWTRKSMGLDEWFKLYRGKFDQADVGGYSVIHDEGRDNVAGLPARWLEYEITDQFKKGGESQTVKFVTRDWYFVDGDYNGILRCAAGARSYLFADKPVFLEIKKRLQRRAR
jgi:hypothetical protein